MTCGNFGHSANATTALAANVSDVLLELEAALTTIGQSSISEPIYRFGQRIVIAYGLDFTGWTFFPRGPGGKAPEPLGILKKV